MRDITEMLQRPIAFHRVFVNLGAGVTGAVMLSQAIYWSRRTGEDGWFYKTQADWEDETGLTRREQETARRKLIAAGVLQEERRGVPAKLFFRVDRDALSAALGVQTSMAESANLGSTKEPRQYGGKRQSIDSTETTAETTAETTIGRPPHGDSPTRSANPKKQRTRLPENFYPNATGIKRAEDAGFSVAVELQAFRDHHEAKGTLMLDWQAAWRTWINNAKKWSKPVQANKTDSDPSPEWVRKAGFSNVWEAENHRCWERNAHEFKNGRRIQA